MHIHQVRRNVIKTICCIVLLAVSAIISLPSTVSAAENIKQSITISPGRTTITVAPGETVRKTFDVINGGTTDYRASLSTSPYSVSGPDYIPRYTPLRGNDITSWIKLEQNEKDLPAQAPVSFPYTISVPRNTKPGGYYAVIFATTTPKISSAGNLIPQNRVGNILYVTVAGPAVTHGALTADTPSNLSVGSSIPITTSVKNDGQVHFLSTASVTIRSMTGSPIKNMSQELMILPGTSRDIHFQWTPSSPFGLYRIDRSALIDGDLQSLPQYWVLHLHPWVLPGFIIIFVIGELLVLSARKRSQQRQSISKT